MPNGSNSPHESPSPGTATSRTTPVSESVVSQIADADDCDPTELPPLYEAIDPDALDALFVRGSPAVQFEYDGHQITITPNEIISVESDD